MKQSDYPWINWEPVSVVAREYNKHSMTLKRWCKSGFILTLGYRVLCDPKGRWWVERPPEQRTHLT